MLQRALVEHSERLETVRGKAERLDEAIAGGQGLHKVVATSRILRQELAEIYMIFQVVNSPAKMASLLLLLFSALLMRIRWHRHQDSTCAKKFCMSEQTP